MHIPITFFLQTMCIVKLHRVAEKIVDAFNYPTLKLKLTRKLRQLQNAHTRAPILQRKSIYT